MLSLAAGSGNRALLDQQLASAGVELRITHEAAHVWALIGMVEAGLGCALVPAMALKAAPAGVAAVTIRGNPLKRKIALLTAVERRLTPLAQRLLPELRSAFSN